MFHVLSLREASVPPLTPAPMQHGLRLVSVASVGPRQGGGRDRVAEALVLDLALVDLDLHQRLGQRHCRQQRARL
eukprot:1323557-Rhodomonas_salina.1